MPFTPPLTNLASPPTSCRMDLSLDHLPHTRRPVSEELATRARGRLAAPDREVGCRRPTGSQTAAARGAAGAAHPHLRLQFLLFLRADRAGARGGHPARAGELVPRRFHCFRFREPGLGGAAAGQQARRAVAVLPARRQVLLRPLRAALCLGQPLLGRRGARVQGLPLARASCSPGSSGRGVVGVWVDDFSACTWQEPVVQSRCDRSTADRDQPKRTVHHPRPLGLLGRPLRLVRGQQLLPQLQVAQRARRAQRDGRVVLPVDGRQEGAVRGPKALDKSREDLQLHVRRRPAHVGRR
jgi:hypothetical protein